jgi:hypothetical protein
MLDAELAFLGLEGAVGVKQREHERVAQPAGEALEFAGDRPGRPADEGGDLAVAAPAADRQLDQHPFLGAQHGRPFPEPLGRRQIRRPQELSAFQHDLPSHLLHNRLLLPTPTTQPRRLAAAKRGGYVRCLFAFPAKENSRVLNATNGQGLSAARRPSSRRFLAISRCYRPAPLLDTPAPPRRSSARL